MLNVYTAFAILIMMLSRAMKESILCVVDGVKHDAQEGWECLRKGTAAVPKLSHPPWSVGCMRGGGAASGENGNLPLQGKEMTKANVIDLTENHEMQNGFFF